MFDKLRFKIGVKLVQAAQEVLPHQAWATSIVVNMETGLVAIADSSACTREEVRALASQLTGRDIEHRMVRMRAAGCPEGLLDTIKERVRANGGPLMGDNSETMLPPREPGSWKVRGGPSV